MNDIDLAQFQFDYDLTWAAFFMNPDGTIYGRYGTRSAKGPMAHNSIDSLKNAMKRAIELHRGYPDNRASLAGKRGAEPKWKTVSEIPAIWKNHAQRLMQPASHRNCIHCHHVHNGWIETAYDEGTFDLDSIWRYPLPDNIGIPIDVDTGNVVENIIAGSPAAQAGIQADDVIKSMNGQPIISQADMQWVLHHLPNTAQLSIEVERGGKGLTKIVALTDDWKRSDISWRESLYAVRPRLHSWIPELSDDEKARLGLGPERLALNIQRVFSQAVKNAGLKEGDILIEAGGQTQVMTGLQFKLWLKLNYQSGDKLPVKVLRDNQEVSLMLPLD